MDSAPEGCRELNDDPGQEHLLHAVLRLLRTQEQGLRQYVSLHYLLKHMAHLVQAAVWTAGLDDRLTDSGLIPF